MSAQQNEGSVSLHLRLVPVDHPTQHNIRVVKLVRELTKLGLREAIKLTIDAAGSDWVLIIAGSADDREYIERYKTQLEALGCECRVGE